VVKVGQVGAGVLHLVDEVVVLGGVEVEVVALHHGE